MNSEKVKALAMLIVAAFLGGAVMPILVRIGTTTVHPFIFNWFRALATLLFLIPVVIKNRKMFQERSFQKLIVLAGLGIGLNVTFFGLGINKTTIVASQLLYALVPILASLVAFFFLKEKLSFKKILAILLGLVGVLILIIFSNSADQRLSLGSVDGNLIILAGVFFYTLYIVVSKKFSKIYQAIHLAIATNSGMLLFTFWPALRPLTTVFKLEQLTPQLFVVLLGLGLSSVLFLFCFQFGLQKLSTSTSTITILLSPSFAAISGYIFYGEKISLVLFISITIISSAVLLSFMNEKQSLQEQWQQTKNRVSGLLFNRL